VKPVKRIIAAAVLAAFLVSSDHVAAQRDPPDASVMSPETHFSRGEFFESEGLLVAARDDFQDATILDPLSIVYVLALGRVELALGNPDGAFRAVTRAHELDRERQRQFERLYTDLKDLPRAEQDAIIARASGVPWDDIFKLEFEYYAAVQDRSAIAALECPAMAALGSQLDRHLPAMARDTNPVRRERGLWLLRTLTEVCPADGTAAWNYARALYAAGDERAGPQLAAAFRQTGDGSLDDLEALYRTSQYREAYALATSHAVKDPLSVNDPFIGSFAAFHLDRYRDQIALAERAQELTSEATIVELLQRTGMSYAVLGNHAAARATLERAVGLAPSDTPARQWRMVEIYALEGKDALIAAGRAEPYYMTASQSLELAYLGMHDIAERSERSGNLYAAMSNYALALRALDDFHRDGGPGTDWALGEHATVLATIDRLQATVPVKLGIAPEAMPFVRQAEQAARRKDARAAAGFYQQAIVLSPWSPELRYNHALALAGGLLNDLPWAVSEMQRFVALSPGDRRIAVAQQKIAQWEGMIVRVQGTRCGGVRHNTDPNRNSPLGAPTLLIQPLVAC
jgi:tetratricopeptide (TPR) repeat protein